MESPWNSSVSPRVGNRSNARLGSPNDFVTDDFQRRWRPKTAVVSFLFNWPTRGGGNTHTVGLVKTMRRAGFEVEHLYAHIPENGIGIVDEDPGTRPRAVDFSADEWRTRTVQHKFCAAVNEFEPELVLITDAWNFKPLLAQALSHHRFVLRFDAQECLCPLNNLRLLPNRDGGYANCPFNQLASPHVCRNCVRENSRRLGALHEIERDVSGQESDEYYETLMQAIANASAILVVNPMIATFFEPVSQNVYVIPPGVDGDRFPWPVNDECRFDPSRPTTILFASDPREPIKGFSILQQACSKLWERRRDFRLVVTATSDQPVVEFADFIGWQSQQELPDLFQRAEIVTVPSTCPDSFPIVALEAMAAGSAIVASRIGGLPLLLVEGTTGLLFDTGSVGELAARLEFLLNNPTQCQRMGQLGRRRFEENFTWEAVWRRHYVPLFDRLAMTQDSLHME